MSSWQHISEHYHVLYFIDQPVPVVFFLTEQLLAVNLGNDALVRFQNTVMNNNKGRPSESHHNILLEQFQLWEVFGSYILIKPLSQSFTIVVKDPFRMTSTYLTKWIIQILQMQHQTHFKTLNTLTFSEFMWIPFIKFLPLPISLRWTNIDTPYLRHFPDMRFIQPVFSDVDCQLKMGIPLIFNICMATAELQKPALCCPSLNSC